MPPISDYHRNLRYMFKWKNTFFLVDLLLLFLFYCCCWCCVFFGFFFFLHFYIVVTRQLTNDMTYITFLITCLIFNSPAECTRSIYKEICLGALGMFPDPRKTQISTSKVRDHHLVLRILFIYT